MEKRRTIYKTVMSALIILMLVSMTVATNESIDAIDVTTDNVTNDTTDNVTISITSNDFPINKTVILENFTRNMENLTRNQTLPANAISTGLSYTNPSSGISMFATKFSRNIYATGGQYWTEYSFYLPVASYVNVGMSGTVVSNLNANAYTNYVLIADGNQWGSYVDNYPTYSWFNGGYMGISATELFYLNKGWHTVYLLGQSTPQSSGSYSVWGSLSIIAIPEYTAITVASPNGGENWGRGTTKTITWQKDGNPGTNVKIELYKGGIKNADISSKTPNDGYYSWYIPTYQPIGTDYKIKITSYEDSKYYDWSNNNFIIY